ncbi:MAG: DUF4197 domain-containing protein [Gammaproteobacteria bacterium]|nr:DUF4197 domain-containing protein [Gammaproteobacteria bacterium]
MKARILILLTVIGLQVSLVGCRTDLIKAAFEDNQGLDAQTIAAGLKEALQQGTQQGVNALGQVDGYLGNGQVSIPVPAELRKVEKFLRKIGADRYADDFIVSLNRAAEAAVPHAKAIFVDVIRNMTISDAVGILQGPDNAATQYFRRNSETRLTASFRPIVVKATGKVGVTSYYKRFVKQAERLGLTGSKDLDLDNYVTSKTLDGLYLMIAAEERRIRQDPVARTTELLRRVFQ